MSFDLAAALRALKPEKHVGTLEHRADAELPWAADEERIGSPLLLDTSVYLDVLQARTSEDVDRLLRYRTCKHSSVCLGELTHLFGRLDPAHPGTKDILRTVSGVIRDIPVHRLHVPDAEIWGKGGIIAGLLMRLSGVAKNAGHERRFLNDALVFLQARSIGASVLTGNIRDFDFLNQLLPSGRIILYRRTV